MNRGNVLVIGNSGVGKSTLINAVFGDAAINKAKAGRGTKGTTVKLAPYESDDIPFRLIDTVGFEPSPLKAMQAINAVKNWSKASAKKGLTDTQINVIWFCVEGTAGKLFPKAIKDFANATKMWASVPVVIVITKSYSQPERDANIELVKTAFSEQRKHATRLRGIMPVVASTFPINDDVCAPPEGITELIDATNDLMPEGIRAAATDIATFKLTRKRAFAHGVVGLSTASAATIGAIPIPLADAVLLAPLEVGEVNALAMVYGINKNEASKRFLNSIVEVGTISLIAKTAISGLKAIPGVALGASVLNAIIAGCIAAAIGEGTIYAFEQIYLGKKSVEDIDWVKKVMESQLSAGFLEKVNSVVASIGDNVNAGSIAKIIQAVFTSSVNTLSDKSE